MKTNNSALWAIVFILLLLVTLLLWVQANFGPEVAGAALVAVFVTLIMFAGQFMTLLQNRTTLDGHARIKAQETIIDREKEKTNRVKVVHENRLELLTARQANRQARQMFGYWKATEALNQERKALTTTQPTAPAAPSFWSQEVVDDGNDIQGLF